MTTSVKMVEETKSELERLQATIRLKTGQHVTQQEILARLVDRAIESKGGFIDSFRDDLTELDTVERSAFHEWMISSGTQTSEGDIKVLYG